MSLHKKETKDGPATGEHSVRMTLSIDYFMRKYKTGSTPQDKDKTKKTRRAQASDYKSFYLTYKIGASCSGESDVLEFDSSQVSFPHEFLVDTDFIAELNQHGVEVTLWEWVSEEEAARRAESLPSKAAKPSNMFATHFHSTHTTEHMESAVPKEGPKNVTFKGKRGIRKDKPAESKEKEDPRKDAGFVDFFPFEFRNGKLDAILNRNAGGMGSMTLTPAPKALFKNGPDFLRWLENKAGPRPTSASGTSAVESSIADSFEKLAVDSQGKLVRPHDEKKIKRQRNIQNQQEKLAQLQNYALLDLSDVNEKNLDAFQALSRITAKTLAQSMARAHANEFAWRNGHLITAAELAHIKTGPAPHHYDLPEKHLLGPAYGVFKFRTSQMALIGLDKEGPSPHHNEHPYNQMKRAKSASSVGKASTTKVELASSDGRPQSRQTLHGQSRAIMASKRDNAYHRQAVLKDKSKLKKPKRPTLKLPGSAQSISDVGELNLDEQLHEGSVAEKSIITGSMSKLFSANNSDIVSHRGKDNRKTNETGKKKSQLEALRMDSPDDKGASREGLQRLHDKFNDAAPDGPPAKGDKKMRRKALVPVEVAKIRLDVTPLFVDEIDIQSPITTYVDGMEDMRILISVSESLLSPEQKAFLNPMSIHFQSADGMPNAPLSYTELQDKCLPPYLRFKLAQDTPDFIVKSLVPHQEKIYLDKHYVILTGLMNEEKMRELIKQTHQVEVHDRDFKVPDDLSKVSEESLNAALKKMNNPFGVAQFGMQDLLLGRTHLHYSLPILPAKPVSTDPFTTAQANWLQNAATLEIQVSILKPLKPNYGIKNSQTQSATDEAIHDTKSHAKEVKDKKETKEAREAREIREAEAKALAERLANPTFGRLYLVAKQVDLTLIERITLKVMEMNAKTLLSSDEKNVNMDALRQYRLSPEQRKSAHLDVISGYHICDSEYRILLVEGIAEKGLNELALYIQSCISTDYKVSDAFIPVLTYDSQQLFAYRSWVGVNASLVHIESSTSITSVMTAAKSFIRKSMPRSCFECVTLLHQMVDAATSKDLLQRHYQSQLMLTGQQTPTTDMINALLHQYGRLYDFDAYLKQQKMQKQGKEESVKQETSVHIPQDLPLYHTAVDAKANPRPPTPYSSRREVNPPFGAEKIDLKLVKKRVEDRNVEYIVTRQKEPKYFRSRNFVEMYKRTFDTPQIHWKRDPDVQVYNYSIQHLSEANKQLQVLRLKMDKHHSYLYGMDYLSQQVAPVDKDKVIRLEEKMTKSKWIHSHDFTNAQVIYFKS